MNELEKQAHNKFVIDNYGAKFEEKGEIRCERCSKDFSYRVFYFIGHKSGGCKIECPNCGCLHSINTIETGFVE